MLKKFDAYDGISFCGGLVFYAPVALLVRTQAGISTSLFFVLQAMMSAVTFLGEVPTGLITERVGYKRTLVLSQFLIFAGRALLMLGYLFKNPVFFVLETVTVGVACCFASGTGEAYVYEVYGEENYLSKAAQTGNWGTAGFLLSTLLYVFLYRAFGITGLLAATVLCALAGACFSLALPREKHVEKSGRAVPSFRSLLRVMKAGRALIVLSSLFSVAGILVNFFYAEKLRVSGLALEWMSPIIFAYSAVQMLAKPILDALSKAPRGRVLGGFCAVAALTMMAFGFAARAVPIVALMVVLPLLLSVPGYCLAERENALIDRCFGGENRAASLSVLSMGCDLVEILALFATAALTGANPAACFLATGTLLLLCGLRFFFE